MGEYAPQLVPGLQLRDDVKPLEIDQPAGASFTLDGNELRWQNWSMRLGFNYREGLVLHSVGYEDGGHVRPVAHRLSFAEMVVPYRDPSPDHFRRTAFDIGEWGLGHMTTSLELGCDCLGEISYLDATLFNAIGEPVEIKNAVCIHEEDDGVLWKHVDHVLGADTRRMRRLVISFHATVANYEYLVYWRFYQDGSIQCEVRATGIMITTPFARLAHRRYGTVVDTDTYAPFHQHFIVARLDLDIDGAGHNTVVCTESEPLPVSDQNPHGLALTQRTTPLRFESDGGPGLRLAPPAGVEGDQRVARRTGSAARCRTSSSRGRRSHRFCRPTRPCSSAPGRSSTTCGSPPTRLTSAGPAVNFPTSRSTTAASRSGPPRIARSRTPTSCSGMCSGSTTSRVPKTGR